MASPSTGYNNGRNGGAYHVLMAKNRLVRITGLTFVPPQSRRSPLTRWGREPPLESGPDRIRRVGQFQSVKVTKSLPRSGRSSHRHLRRLRIFFDTGMRRAEALPGVFTCALISIRYSSANAFSLCSTSL